MADLDRIKRNVAKMASMNAPESDIDGYIASEGVTIEQVRNYKFSNQTQPQPQVKPVAQPQPVQKPIAPVTQEQPQEQMQTLTGGVETKRIPNWDKKGRIYYTDEFGNKIKDGLNPFERVGRKIKATASNVQDWLEETNPESEAYKQKANVALTLATLPMGLGKLGTQFVASKLAPIVGRKVGQATAQGVGSGLVGGGVYGAGEALIEGENPVTGALKGGTIGALTGGALGGGVAKIGRNIKAKNLRKQRAERPQVEVIEPVEETATQAPIQKLTKASMKKELNAQIRQLKKEIEIPEITKGTYKRGKYKGKYYTKNITDDFTQGIIEADTVLANEIKAIKKNPEIIKNEETFDNAINRIVEKTEGLGQEVQDDYISKYTNAYNKASEIDNLKNIELTPENLGFVENIREQPVGGKVSTLAQKAEKSPEVASAIKENPPLYEAITNAETTSQAQAEIAQNADKVHTDIVKKLVDDEREFTALDVEKARQLFGELQKQGRYDEATELIDLVSKQGSKLGQAVQAFSLWSKTTPDGALLYAQKLLDKYNKGVAKKLQKRLTKEEMREIGKAFQKLNESGLTGRELEVETAKAMKKVFKVVPKTFSQKLDGYRYINMLLSGKSRIKDFLLTGKQAFDTAIDESIAGVIDKGRSLVGRDKTRYISANPLTGAKAWLQGAGKGFREGLEDVRYGINTSRSGEVGRYGLPNEPTFNYKPFKQLREEIKDLEAWKKPFAYADQAISNILTGPEKLLRYSMQVPDRMFFEARYASSLANQMKARGVTEPTQDMINRALEEARRAVFQENRPITQGMMEAVEGLDNRTVRALERDVLHIPQGTLPSVSRSFAPFVKTPTNVIAQGAEGLHGLGSGSFKLKNAIEAGDPEAIREAELLIGRGGRGLGELALGLAVGKNAWDNIQTNIGNKDYYQNEITGLKPNSVVIGDKAFSMQNMQSNLPFFTGTGLGQRGLGQAYTNTADVIAEMPALKALGDVYNINKEANYIAQSDDPDKELLKKGDRMVRSLGANYLTSLLPFGGEMGEIRNDIDPYARELRDDESTRNYLRNRVTNRIPFASQTLPIRYNAVGEPVMVNNIQNPVGRVASEMVDFGIRNYTPDETYNELNQFRDSIADTDITGKTTVGIKKAKKKIRGMDRALTNKEYSDYQKIYGRLSKQLKGELFENNQNLTQEEMAKELQTMTQSIDEATKAVLFGIQPTRKPKKYTQAILDTVDWESLLNNE